MREHGRIIARSAGKRASRQGGRSWSTRWGYSLVAALLLCWLMVAPAAVLGEDSAPRNLLNATEADNGRTLSLQSGEGLSVSLKITTGTGYTWRITHLDRKVLRPDGAPTTVHNAHPMPGASALQVFRFMGAGAGTTHLEFEYARPWEKDVAPVRTFRLDVTVS